MGLNHKGRNWGPLVNWVGPEGSAPKIARLKTLQDSLGKAYAGLIISWTVLLIAGSLWLISKRRVSFIKMRNLPLALASTLFLHVYLVKIMLAYTTNGHFECSAEFWIMSIYLPFGIALFQANVTQIRSISDRQGRLLLRQTSQSSLDSTAPSARRLSHGPALRRRWAALSEVQRSYVYIAVFMLLQVCCRCLLMQIKPLICVPADHERCDLRNKSGSAGRLALIRPSTFQQRPSEMSQIVVLVRSTLQDAVHVLILAGSLPPSGNSSGPGYMGPGCCTRSGTFETLTIGDCRLFSPSSVGCLACLYGSPRCSRSSSSR